MKEADFKDCIESNNVIKVSRDDFKINSLIETYKARINFLQSLEINEKNSNFIFEGYYSSLLEISHSLLLKQGYKINNHICIGYFLRDELKNEDLYLIFDDCRNKRNLLVYYGKMMGEKTAIESITKIKNLIKKLEK